MRKRVWKSGFIDRGVVKFPIHNKDGILCGWLTIWELIRRQQFQEYQMAHLRQGEPRKQQA